MALTDFDRLTLNQYSLLAKKSHEDFKAKSEVRSQETLNAINNALSKSGTPYRCLWANEEKTTVTKDDMQDLFREVGVDV